MAIWTEITQAIHLALALKSRWNLATWEARLSAWNSELGTKEHKLRRMEEIASHDAANISQRVDFRLDMAGCFWERPDAASVHLLLAIANRSVYDLLIDRITGEVKHVNGPKITDLTPRLDPIAIAHQETCNLDWDFRWLLSDRDQGQFRSNNRVFPIRIRISAHIATAHLGDFACQRDMSTQADISAELRLPDPGGS